MKMTQTNLLKMVTGLIFSIISVATIITGNEAVFPSAILLAIVMFQSIKRNAYPADLSKEETNLINKGKAASLSITILSVTIAIMSLFSSLYFAQIASAFGWDKMFDGDFVGVFINDNHEFCYYTILLHIVYSFARIVYKLKRI